MKPIEFTILKNGDYGVRFVFIGQSVAHTMRGMSEQCAEGLLELASTLETTLIIRYRDTGTIAVTIRPHHLAYAMRVVN